MAFADITPISRLYMPIYIRNPENFIRKLTIATISFMICWGFVLVLAQIKPFWIDEWRIIYNLKYKSAADLWGHLDFLQQFPRVYLESIKAFCAPFDYSYFTLRFPSFVAGTLAIILCYRLMKTIYKTEHLHRFLFVLIIISSHAFTEYYVQIKQYTMEMLLSLLAIWQLLQLLKEGVSNRRYIFLCLSFFIAPFFSYTYPIVAAPVFVVIFIQSVHFLRQRDNTVNKAEWLTRQWLPLGMCVAGIVFFCISDVAQLMADRGMHQYWAYQMMNNGFDASLFFKNTFRLFAQVGGGLVFEIIFGIIGLLAFILAIYKCATTLFMRQLKSYELVRLYSVLLLLLAIGLFVAGKLPLGEARLNIFTVPAIAILIVDFLVSLGRTSINPKLATSFTVILFIAACGHIFTSSVKVLAGSENHRKLDIYVNTENAIILAQAKKIPIVITSGVAYPYQKMINLPGDLAATLCIPPRNPVAINMPHGDNISGDWVLETFPAYKVAENIPVYGIDNLNDLKGYLQQLPPCITSVLAGDGRSFRIVNRNE